LNRVEKFNRPAGFRRAMEPFTRRYAPQKLSDIIGQDKAVRALRQFIVNYGSQKKKAALLYGPSGCGKTSIAYALARESGLEILEVNASDFRNKEQVQKNIGAAVGQQSLFSKGKLILVDEVDGLSGTKDRGGLQALLKLMQNSTFPILLTLTNPWDPKFASLRTKSLMVAFDELGPEQIFLILSRAVKGEKLEVGESVLKQLARQCGGDARAAITDLQTLVSGKKTIDAHDLEGLGMREKQQNMIQALLKIFKATDPKIAITALDDVEEDLDKSLLWIDENLPSEYEKPEELVRAYDKLSRADMFSRRIRRWQHWRFMIYINALLTAGVAVSKDAKYKKVVMYKPTGRILKMWWAKQKNMKKKAIAFKLAGKLHTSQREMVKNMPYLQVIYKKDKDMANSITREFQLEKEEVQWLRK